MVNNFDRIRPLLTWSSPVIYHLQILQRSKDGHDKASRLIAEWFITSERQFDFLRPAIVSLCNEYSARAYINLNGKRPESVIYKMLEGLVERIKNKTYNPLNLLASSVAQCNSNFKIWIIDVDNFEYDLNLICSRIEQCRSGMTKNVIDILETVNGYHILTCPFNLQEFTKEGFEDITIHKNNPTVLYATL